MKDSAGVRKKNFFFIFFENYSFVLEIEKNVLLKCAYRSFCFDAFLFLSTRHRYEEERGEVCLTRKVRLVGRAATLSLSLVHGEKERSRKSKVGLQGERTEEKDFFPSETSHLSLLLVRGFRPAGNKTSSVE